MVDEAPEPAKLPYTPPTSAPPIRWSKEALSVAPVSRRNWPVTTVIELPTSRSSVFKRLPARVFAAL